MNGALGDYAWLVPWLFALSLGSLVLVLVAVPVVVVRLPADYFRGSERRPPARPRHPLVSLPLRVLKNVVACAFVALGIALLVLPGQGLLTILVGVLLLDFPGKYRLERWLVARPRVLATFNNVRRRAGRAAFELEPPAGRPAPADGGVHPTDPNSR